jgi:hypothetical protein
MRTTARFLLLLGAMLLIAYPLWGLLDPGSYGLELKDHYLFGEGASSKQIRSSAAMLWLSNGFLAISFVHISRYIKTPENTSLAMIGGCCLIIYPFLRTFVEVWSGLNLTSHIEAEGVAIEFSSEKALYVVYGMAVIGMAIASSEINKTSKKDSLTAASVGGVITQDED